MNRLADSIVALYRRHAGAWSAARLDGARGPGLMEAGWLARFRALLPPGAEVLDLGCGPGVPIARHLVEHGHPVTGIDSAPEMIELFRRNLARPPETKAPQTHAPQTQASASPAIAAKAIVADMRGLALGRRFGGLIAWDSFFHLSREDQRLMFPVFAAHAAPGAPLLFTAGPAEGDAIGTLEGEPLYHASLDPAEYRARLDAAGFDLVAHQTEDPACGGHTIWLARRR
ncbi:SAM-dependent methyltransferase [Ancylobacter sp. 3268]|uniref:class I SAM-dependent DNA methyltransferase n=1 Tax=Ancylobacter sp. 3268 TaxID=2817752 RepID=UPI00286252F7|nr:class I SAM-dependent methyltransferase [Ancylobacter sp. 3268]MDR6954458.1 SAM-dependent methyltransferase [Ancylobacter sp. 3268]